MKTRTVNRQPNLVSMRIARAVLWLQKRQKMKVQKEYNSRRKRYRDLIKLNLRIIDHPRINCQYNQIRIVYKR